MYHDLVGERGCLIYSYGVSQDLAFEKDMAALGCEVHAFDEQKRKRPEMERGGAYFWLWRDLILLIFF